MADPWFDAQTVHTLSTEEWLALGAFYIEPDLLYLQIGTSAAVGRQTQAPPTPSDPVFAPLVDGPSLYLPFEAQARAPTLGGSPGDGRITANLLMSNGAPRDQILSPALIPGLTTAGLATGPLAVLTPLQWLWLAIAAVALFALTRKPREAGA